MVRALIATVVLGLAASAAAQSISEVALSDPHASPGAIVRGPDGNLWFTERQDNALGRISPSGGGPTAFNAPVVMAGGLALRTTAVTGGPDGNVWFLGTETSFGYVGKMTSAGVGTQVSDVISNRLFSITSGPDGNLWFTGVTNSILTIFKMTTAGVVTQYPAPTSNTFGATAGGITSGPDGNLWFTETSANRIGKITPGGTISEYTLSAGSSPSAIVAGPDGALWFTESSADKIGRMTTDGTLTNEFPVPTAGANPQDIVAALDGNLWFTESAQSASKIGRITTAGVVTEYGVPTASSQPFGIAYAGGSLWFTENFSGKIGQVAGVGPGPCVPGPSTLCLNGNRFKVEVSWSAPDQNQSGTGTAMPLTGDTGYFWFFSSANVELIVKVLDASAVNHHFWVFYGALSDVAYTIHITDTTNNLVKTYINPDHNLASLADTSAFAADTLGSEFEGAPAASASDVQALSDAELDGLYGALTAKDAYPDTTSACTAGSQALCLNSARFQVKVEWSVPSQNQSGEGQAVPITGDTGYFWFFSNANVELIVKVLDGRAINGHFWVFYGALSNVQYTITVTDTQTNAHRDYENPNGNQASHADTSAF
jgi:streptogramin lyase